MSSSSDKHSIRQEAITDMQIRQLTQKHTTIEKSNPGRPKKLCKQDARMLLRKLLKLKAEVKSFTTRRIKPDTCTKHASDWFVCRLMNKFNSRYLHSRKNGLFAKKRAHSRFARKLIKYLSPQKVLPLLEKR